MHFVLFKLHHFYLFENNVFIYLDFKEKREKENIGN